MDTDMEIPDDDISMNGLEDNHQQNRLFLPSLDPLYSSPSKQQKQQPLLSYSPTHQITHLRGFFHPSSSTEPQPDRTTLVLWIASSSSPSSPSAKWIVYLGPNSKYNFISSSSSETETAEIEALDAALDIIRRILLSQGGGEEDEEMITQVKIATASEEVVDGFGLGLVGEMEGEKGEKSGMMRRVWDKLEELEFGEEVGGVGVEFWGVGVGDEEDDEGEEAREGMEDAVRILGEGGNA